MPRKKAPDTDETGPTSSIRVSKTVKKRLKVYAVHNDMDMRPLADKALDEYLKKRGA